MTIKHPLGHYEPTFEENSQEIKTIPDQSFTIPEILQMVNTGNIVLKPIPDYAFQPDEDFTEPKDLTDLTIHLENTK